jgi:hypothetical protein
VLVELAVTVLIVLAGQVMDEGVGVDKTSMAADVDD